MSMSVGLRPQITPQRKMGFSGSKNITMKTAASKILREIREVPTDIVEDYRFLDEVLAAVGDKRPFRHESRQNCVSKGTISSDKQGNRTLYRLERTGEDSFFAMRDRIKASKQPETTSICFHPKNSHPAVIARLKAFTDSWTNCPITRGKR